MQRLLSIIVSVVGSLLPGTWAVWQPSDRAALDAGLAAWRTDRDAAERAHGPIGTWDVSLIKDPYATNPEMLWSSQRTASVLASETAKYQQLRAQCTWEVQPRQAMLMSFPNYETYSAAQLGLIPHVVWPDEYGPPSLTESVERCELPMGDGSVLLIDRVLASSEPGSWITYYWADVGTTSRRLERPKSIVQCFTGAVNAEGEVLGYPPLEMHHLHVGTNLASTLIFQSHTDSQLTMDNGGTDGLLLTLPDGYGMHFASPLNTVGAIVDVRSDGVDGAPALKFHIEVGVVVSPRQTIAVSTFGFGNGFLARNVVTKGTTTYLHPAERTSLFWFSMPVRESASYPLAWCHSHWEWTSEMLFFKAHPAQLGLTRVKELMPAHPWDEIDLVRAGFTPTEVRALLLGSLAEAQHNVSEQPAFIGACASPWEAVGNHSFSRFPTLPSFTVKEGDILTLVAFHRPHTEEDAFAGLIRMHAAVLGIMIRDDGTSTYGGAIGAPDPAWAWTGADFQKYELFEILRAGGVPFEPPKTPPKSTGTLHNIHVMLMTLAEIVWPHSSLYLEVLLPLTFAALCGILVTKLLQTVKARKSGRCPMARPCSKELLL